MKITFLGTGSSQGTPVIPCTCSTCTSRDFRDKRLRSSVHLDRGGQSLLIDASPDLRYQALRAGIRRIDALLLTHEHKDHIGGLGEIRSSVLKQGKPIAVYAGERVLTCIRQEFHYLLDEESQLTGGNFTLHEIGSAPFEVLGMTVHPIQVYHNKLPIWGFRLGPLTYITDAKIVPEEEIKKIKGTQLLVVNAFRMKPHHAHFNLEEALKFIEKVGPKTTYLTHISHQMGLHVEVSRYLPGRVQLAHDGLQVSL